MYNKQIILDYLVKNNVIVHECENPKIFTGIETGKIQELLKSIEIEVIDNEQYLFIVNSFFFGGNNIGVAKELLSKASRQNNILPIKFIRTNGYVECAVGIYIYNILEEYIKRK